MGYKITILGEPKGKARPKAQLISGGSKNYIHIYTPQKSLDYENYIKWSFQEAKGDQAPYMNKEPLIAIVKIYHSIPKSESKKRAQLMREDKIKPIKKYDIDNILKSIFDSLNGLAYKDDTQIIQVIATKFYSDIPRVEVEIKEYSNNNKIGLQF